MSDKVNVFEKEGMRLTLEAIGYIKENDLQLNIDTIITELKSKGKIFIDKVDIEPYVTNDDKIPLPVKVIRKSHFQPLAKEYSAEYKIHYDKDVTGKSRCTGTLSDFVTNLKDRFTKTSDLLRVRMGSAPIIQVKDMTKMEGQDVRLIIIINERRMSKKGNIVLEVEDETGNTLIIASKSDPVYETAETLIDDDIIMVEGRVYNTIFIAKNITWPDIPVSKDIKVIEQDLATVYLSDIHVGSTLFIEESFTKFINWINGNGPQKELAGKVKYISIAGDAIDGIGVYPSQENELYEKDVYEQYKILNNFLEQVPDYIEIFVSPGNHDAVRRAQPQPMIPDDLFHTRAHKVGSPAWIDIEGIKHLIYHGDSIDSLISSMSHLDYTHIEKPMIEMLRRRHISPIYGQNLVVPEEVDYLVIDDVPDVFHTGHLHRNVSTAYRGVLLINSGTFQNRTDYQIKLGHVPTPGIVPVLEMKTGKMSNLKFYEGEGDKDGSS